MGPTIILNGTTFTLPVGVVLIGVMISGPGVCSATVNGITIASIDDGGSATGQNSGFLPLNMPLKIGAQLGAVGVATFFVK